MANKDDILEVNGIVEEVLPGNMYRVKLAEMHTPVLCYLGGRLKQHKIRIILGDSVKIEMSVYDLSKGRVVYRL